MRDRQPDNAKPVSAAPLHEDAVHAQKRYDETQKWLLASLLAVNGGAIALVLSSEPQGGVTAAFAAVIFFVGLVLSMMFAFMYSKCVFERRASILHNYPAEEERQRIYETSWKTFRFLKNRFHRSPNWGEGNLPSTHEWSIMYAWWANQMKRGSFACFITGGIVYGIGLL